MSTRNTRSETEETAIQLFRKMATRTILFHQAAAQSLGLFPTDLKSADILNEAGPMTAGELGKKTGLSTGSVTALIDRLEKAGYVMRKKDPRRQTAGDHRAADSRKSECEAIVQLLIPVHDQPLPAI